MIDYWQCPKSKQTVSKLTGYTPYIRGIPRTELAPLKHDIATMYKVYSERFKDDIPGKAPIGRSIFYSIAKTITGGGKQQEARA